jgi:hypothetical protein
VILLGLLFGGKEDCCSHLPVKGRHVFHHHHFW